MTDTYTPAFGRLLHHDDRNRAYPVRGVLFADVAPLISRTWWRSGVWSQGQSSSCTAHAAAGVLVSSPFRHSSWANGNLPAYDTYEERFDLYRIAQRYDPWDGEEPQYFGSSTDAPFKVLRERGHIREWRWAFGLDDVLRTLSHHGPVAIGVNWHEGMLASDAVHLIHPTGEIVGGHAVELIGINVGMRTVRVVNSWGEGYGRRGRVNLRWDDLDALLQSSGEAVTIVP